MFCCSISHRYQHTALFIPVKPTTNHKPKPEEKSRPGTASFSDNRYMTTVLQCTDKLAVPALLTAIRLFLPRNLAFPTPLPLTLATPRCWHGHSQGNKATKYRGAQAPTVQHLHIFLGPKFLPKRRMAAELQVLSYSYVIFKDVAAVKDQAGARAQGGGEASAPGCVSVWWAQGPRELCGTYTLLQTSRCEEPKWNSSLGITKEGASLLF